MDLFMDNGSPAFSSFLHVGRPWTGSNERFRKILDEIFEDAWFTNDGSRVKEFEREIAALHGVKHCIAVTNGTFALEIALRALQAEGDVLMPSFTFIGTAHAAAWIGLKPVFCDIDEDSLTIDVEDMARRVTPNTTCVLGVNIFGHPCDFEKIATFAKEHNLRVLYDSAHCIGGGFAGVPIGRQGDMQILSFNATKTIHTFEGGALITDDDELNEAARRLRNYGYDRHKHVEGLGINAKMSEVSAAYGLACLPDLQKLIATQKEYSDAYENGLSSVPGIRFVEAPAGTTLNYRNVAMLVDEKLFGLSRDELWHVLWAEKVLARRYFHPGCHRMKPYSEPQNEMPSLPVTDKICHNILCLPNDPSLSRTDIEKVCDIIKTAHERCSDIRAWLGLLDRLPAEE